jgi:arylsulfatase A-like enzyme
MNLNKKLLLCSLGVSSLFAATPWAKSKKETKRENKPNIVIFYVDDLGYGDVGYNGAKGVQTPNVDQLAKNGVVFTDAHFTASTSTPSRYSLLTGEYAFRNNAAILAGDAPLLINTKKSTLPSMLKRAGYSTAVVGKWHLGLGNGNVDWNKEIKPGPLEIGFDYSYLIPATGDRVPTVFVENHNVVNLDPNDPIQVSYKSKVGDGIDKPEQAKVVADAQHSQTIVNGIGRIGYMEGGEKAIWSDENFPYTLTSKANNFIEQNKENPFFLFFAFHDIHVPRLPNKRFVGKSTMGPRGDAIVQMDWMTGQVIKKLKELGVYENTLIIFSSDNGPVLDDGYQDQAKELLGEHKPAGVFRGGKYSIYEAGTRVPTIVSWPNKTKAKTSSALISQVDIYKSLAKLVKVETKPNECVDSEDMLAPLLGQSTKGRDYMIEEGFTLGIRNKNYKYIFPLKKAKFPKWLANKDVEGGYSNQPQLYDLNSDISEQKNIVAEFPEIAKKLHDKIIEIRNKN